MPLEHFKTQVLLLHSQQSTLDTLSAGFGDRYAVHVATSGSEALNTLGETPIHVIVSAQDLPGMSGLEALREAKKRSPDTIGILLAGDSRDDGLEALVSDQEVFQIVRGTVTPETLLQLVDQATKRVRLLTLAESANDHAANVDEPVGEHIVMETSENGASIISDGTARMRALRSQNLQISSHVGGRDVDVLVLSKDEDFLTTIRESSRGLHNVHHSNTIAQSEAVVQNHKVGVLVTDAAMAASTIDEITGRLRSFAPRLVAIVAGRRDDGEMLMDLINRGHVYRFLLKPVSPGRARLAIEASVKHHLEAADGAFRAKSPAEAPKNQPAGTATTAGAKTAAAPPAKSAPARSAPAKPAPAKPAPAKPAPARHEDPKPAARRAPTIDPDTAKAAAAAEPVPPGDRLDGAFGESGRFRRTMSGIAASAGKSFGRTMDVPTDGRASAEAAGGSTRRLSQGILGAAAAALVAVVALGWWLMTPSSPVEETADRPAVEKETPAETPTPSVVEADVPQSAIPGAGSSPAETAEQPLEPPPQQAMLDEARAARAAGRIAAPPGNNAIEYYVAARKLAPGDPVIAAELDVSVDDALALTERALLDGRGADAAAALRMVRLADPQNSRLTFLNAQVAQLERRTRLDQARSAIRDSRFEDAASALAAAQRVVGSDRSEIDALAEELAAARSEQRVDEVLNLAGERLAGNALTEPANDNARYYYELALSNDADNAAARQGLAMVASKLVLRAREAIDQGTLDDAERALQDAGALNAESPELAASLQALQNARNAEAEAQAQAEAARIAAAQPAAATAGSDSAATSAPGAAETRSRDSQEPQQELQGTHRALAASLEAPEANEELSLATPGGVPLEAGGSGNRGALSTAGTPRERVGGASQQAAANAGNASRKSQAPEYVAISTLQRTNYVAPRYPRVAQRRGITGWVDVSFTVLTDGSVADIEILNADPQNVFGESATEAVAEWRFEPPMDNGIAVQKQVAVRMMFSLQ